MYKPPLPISSPHQVVITPENPKVKGTTSESVGGKHRELKSHDSQQKYMHSSHDSPEQKPIEAFEIASANVNASNTKQNSGLELRKKKAIISIVNKGYFLAEAKALINSTIENAKSYGLDLQEELNERVEATPDRYAEEAVVEIKRMASIKLEQNLDLTPEQTKEKVDAKFNSCHIAEFYEWCFAL